MAAAAPAESDLQGGNGSAAEAFGVEEWESAVGPGPNGDSEALTGLASGGIKGSFRMTGPEAVGRRAIRPHRGQVGLDRARYLNQGGKSA